METTVSETTVPLVRYSAEKLGEKIPSMGSLNSLKSVGDVILVFGVIVEIVALITFIRETVRAVYVETMNAIAALVNPNYYMESEDSSILFWMIIIGAAIGLFGMVLQKRAKDLIDKFHAIVHQGEVVEFELVQRADQPLKRRFTVRGYTLAGKLALHTRLEEVDPEEGVDPYEFDDEYDVRSPELRAASLEA